MGAGKCTFKLGVTDSRDKGNEGKKIQEKGNVAAAKHLEVAFFTLSVSPIFLFSSCHCVLHQPLYIPQSFEKVGVFFLFYFFYPTFERQKLKKREINVFEILAVFAYYRARFMTN